MTRHMSRRLAAAQTLTLADDLSAIARLESALRVAAADRRRNRRAHAMGRLADWLNAIR